MPLDEKNLPPLRKAVMACNGIPLTIKQELPSQSLQMMDYWYARDYEPSQRSENNLEEYTGDWEDEQLAISNKQLCDSR